MPSSKSLINMLVVSHILWNWMGINYKLPININVDRPKAVFKYNSTVRKAPQNQRVWFLPKI